MGRARSFRASRLRDVRSFCVDGFKNYLIFYQPTPKGIHVFHVHHGARDLEALFRDK
jgi:toxin ParE1/3/4